MHRTTPLPPTLPGLRDVPLSSAMTQAADRVIASETEALRLKRSCRAFSRSTLSDYLFASTDEAADPREVFEHLRWGGQFVFVTHQKRHLQAVLDRYAAMPEFVVETQPQALMEPRRGWRRLAFQRRHYFFVARKVLLARTDEGTDRHSYDVRLIGSPHGREGYVVLKRTPTQEEALHRLALRFPDASEAALRKAAAKLVQKVFPLFLTREAAFLKILQRELPTAYQARVPRVLHMEKDERGFVSQLHLSWLRLGGGTLSHIAFARQAADMLRVLHDTVRVMHLDLRLDNFVITEDGVGFVDFGSAVRVGENVNQSAMLGKLFNEMICNSQIQRDLRRLLERGSVTSNLFINSYRKLDRAIDLFYLVLQMNQPHKNPDFRGLVAYESSSRAARELSRLSREILRPNDPASPPFRTADDVLHGIEHVQRSLANHSA